MSVSMSPGTAWTSPSAAGKWCSALTQHVPRDQEADPASGRANHHPDRHRGHRRLRTPLSRSAQGGLAAGGGAKPAPGKKFRRCHWRNRQDRCLGRQGHRALCRRGAARGAYVGRSTDPGTERPADAPRSAAINAGAGEEPPGPGRKGDPARYQHHHCLSAEAD